MIRNRATAVIVSVVAISTFSWGQLSEAEMKGLEETLSLGNLRLTDLNFARNPFADQYRFSLVDRAIELPIESANNLMGPHSATAGDTASSLLARVMQSCFEEAPGAIQHDPPVGGLEDLPQSLRVPILGLANWLRSANNEIKEATASLSTEEQRLLIESLPVWAVEEPTVSFTFVRGQVAGQNEILELLQKVDLPRIRSVAYRLAVAVERAIGQLRASKDDIEGKLRTKVAGMPLIVAGRGDDKHFETDAFLTVDLGGNDTYTGRHGAGIGYANILIDLGGNDRYEVGDLNLGAGLLGIGLAYDLGGDDVVTTEGICLGSGLAGVGVFSKSGGDDVFRSGVLSQGFGQFGCGLMIDSNGRDKYDLLMFGQGAARTQGVGWLVDQFGNDEYRAGGLVLNSPLFDSAHYSFAQGFGMGYREDTGGISGGIGMITDHSGDDFFLGETYHQGASYWYGLGSLYDRSGNDSYIGHHYCQSSAMHACAAYFFDLDGHDGYLVKVGAAHAIGHDYGVAFLLDRAGDDIYASRDTTPGLGNANGLGVFIEAGGIDRYQGPPGKGNGARGSGSLGVFADLNGNDKYTEGLMDGAAAASPRFGVAFDYPTSVALSAANNSDSETQEAPTPGSIPMPSEQAMAELYAKATQWGVGTAQDEVQESLNEIVGIGSEALAWMLDNRLAAANRLHIRAFVHVVRALGEEGSRLVGVKAFNASDQEMLPLIRIASDARVADFGALLPRMLDNPYLRRSAISAAGTLKANAAVPKLMALCRDDDGLVARAAVVALRQIGDVTSFGTAQALLLNPDMLIRDAALGLVVQFPEQARNVANSYLSSGRVFESRIALKILGSIGEASDLDRLGQSLLDPRPDVRIEALLQLDGRCPVEYRADFEGLKDDPITKVKAIARRVKPGE